MGASRTVVVVGAGAAGLTASIAAGAGARVVLLNAHPRIGLKILMSGGTRCNVTHAEVTERDFHGGSRAVIARVLRAFPVERTLDWLASMGVELKLEETGKYFPVTDDAQTVLDGLMGAASAAGVEVRPGARVVRLEKGPVAGFRLGIQHVRSSAVFDHGGVSRRGAATWSPVGVEPDEWVEADAVVLASGGLSFPRTGSDGTGYSLVQGLGHTLEPPIPALTPLVSRDPLSAIAQGITTDVELSLWSGPRVAQRTGGSMLIAHFGVTGPAALDLSRHWNRAESDERRVTVSFAPGETRESLLASWVDAAARAPRRTARRQLAGWMPERVAERLCEEAGISPGALVGQVDRARRSALIDLALERDLHIEGTLGYEKAEVTAGGVRLSEVDPSTLESRLVPGLFLCGEILDVEGRLGGFNFQWSWSSGTVAGLAATRK